MKKEIVDIRYIAKILFLVLTSVNLGHTFDVVWLGLIFAAFFAVTGFLNATSRREFSKRPKYNKIPAYGAIVPLALYWVMTPGVENGVNPVMVFLPGIYLLFLTALQERSRGNGGYDAFVAFDGIAALLFSFYTIPKGWAPVGFVALLLAVFSYTRRGTAWYKYVLFLLIVAMLSASSYGGWRYWRAHRYERGAKWADDYYQRERVMGFDQVAALGSFGSNYNGKYNSQVVLRVWDAVPSMYLKAASYEKYVAGIWKLPTVPVKTLTPAYYQVDYAVLEVADSLTKPFDTTGAPRPVRQVWVQSTINNFGFVFAPYGTVGFAAKDVDSLQYFAGGMVNGLGQNGKRSDWHYFVCDGRAGSVGYVESTDSAKFFDCQVPDSLLAYRASDLQIGKRYEPLMDSVIDAMGLVRRDSLNDSLAAKQSVDGDNLQRILVYFKDNFTYSLQIPGLNRWQGSSADPSKDPLSVFWHARQGFCEYYATLSVLALRRVGIPARYVTGFARPEVVEGRPYAIFRRKHAHSWVEAFVDGHWVIFDPTPPMLTPLGNEPNWFVVKWEGLQGRFARAMHFLKEGEWRRTVDSWQNYTQKITDGMAIYVALALAFVAFIFLKSRNVLKNRQKKIVAKSNNAILWSKKLEQSEKELARLGLRRDAGETVGTFAKRVQAYFEQMNGDEVKLKAQRERISAAIKVLEDYESCRWRR